MANIFIEKGIKFAIKGGEKIAKVIAPEAVNVAAKIGNDIFEHQKSLINIPDMSDVNINDAMELLNKQLDLTVFQTPAKPNSKFAEMKENTIVYSIPRFGKKVPPKTPVKFYYLTEEVIQLSKNLKELEERVYKKLNVIGQDINHAKTYLEGMGLSVNVQLEQPNVRFAKKSSDMVTRITYINNKKIDRDIKKGDTIVVYYINENVLSESIKLRDLKIEAKSAKIENIKVVGNKAFVDFDRNRKKLIRKIRRKDNIDSIE